MELVDVQFLDQLTHTCLGLTRITFPGYSHDQLMTIIQSRLDSVPSHIVDSDAIQFASRKVAAVSGDARRALDICRRAVEIAEGEAAATQNPLLETPSKRRSNDRIAGRERSNTGKVTIATIKQAINEATGSPLQQYLKSLPLATKVFLAAMQARTRRTGVSESLMADVIEEAKRLGLMATDNRTIEETLLTDSAVISQELPSGRSTPSRKLLASAARVPRMLAMGSAAIELAEAGIISVEGGSGRNRDRVGHVRLSIGEEEVKLALREDDEVRNMGFSS